MRTLVLAGLALALAACSRSNDSGAPQSAAAPVERSFAAVDDARLLAADQDAANWMSYGRTYDEQRFSPLKQINTQTIGELKLAWHYDLDAARRGQESTPIVVDGVMYVTSAWSKVFALDAKTGTQLWTYDPKVPGEKGVDACCDVVNRGVAVWKGKVYLGALDGRLIALDAKTGAELWSVVTTEPNWRYTITGAPRVVKGKVLIGNGGSELGARGYISAYDAETGKMAWRFYTVPGDPAKGFEHPALEKAAKTWTGEWWKQGGGGTVWDAMAYDPQLDLLYVGVGNGSPWNQAIRSPKGGDNLYLTCILALRPDTGDYVWHYQTTPGETWDYTATQHIMLADLQIDGRARQVLMQAPKNGFFYVLDRTSGELISAKPFTQINWATGVDMKTGRPVEVADSRYDKTGKPWIGIPGPIGAHGWQPMAFSPETRLVYLPVNDTSFPYIPAGKDPKILKTGFNLGLDLDAAVMPRDPAVRKQAIDTTRGHLAAWDPVAQREVWRAQYEWPWNGGVLATAGNLVFQGTAMGEFVAYQADTGARLWAAPTQAGVLAPPISYEIDGEQYIALEVGWGGALALAAGEPIAAKHAKGNTPRVLVFTLKGSHALPAEPPPVSLQLNPPTDKASPATVARGKALFANHCGVCHGDAAVSGGILPDLRYSKAIDDPAPWQAIVHDGLLKDKGMIGFGSELSKDDVESVRAYVVRRAHETVQEAKK
jgi:quinohemoprotein ethanol dehydrogenase